MAQPNSNPGGGTAEQEILSMAQRGVDVSQIASSIGWSESKVASFLGKSGYAVKTNYPSVAGIPVQGSYSTPSYSYSKINAAAGTSVRQDNPPPPAKPTASAGTYPDALDEAKKNSGIPVGQKPAAPATGNNLTNPNAALQKQLANLQAQLNGQSGSAAADLAERKREFNITTSRDIAKQNASEVDSLQQRLAGMSGPKDAYADYFWSHGLMPPQGYKPAPVPLTDAQTAAYKKQGVTPQQLQQMLTGGGKPGGDTGMLGNLGSSLQTPAGLPQFQNAPSPSQASAPANPTVQGGQLYGKNPVVPGTLSPPTTPGGVPSMEVGGEVPGPTGTPKLAVLHGGEEVIPANGGQPPMPQSPQQGNDGAMMEQPGLHPAIAALVDAVSNLLSNPDFKPFVAATQQTTQATPSGVPSMASGGTMPFNSNEMLSYQQTGRNPQMSGVMGGTAPAPPTSSSALGNLGFPGGTQPSGTQHPLPPQPIGSPPVSGLPTGGAQGVNYNTGKGLPTDKPIMPIANMDPYTRALYDINGRLHPYSAQQETQMGPQGQAAVESYMGKVQGGDVNAYKDLVNRLRPQSGAPSASTGSASEGFSFG